MTDRAKDISSRRHEIERARREKMMEAMDEYDRTVFYPALKALREECEQVGHTKGSFHNNGLGWTWWWCSKCGAAMEKESIYDQG